MPPNRKGAFDTVDTLAILNASQFVETSKFQPLAVASLSQRQPSSSKEAKSSSSSSNNEEKVVKPAAAGRQDAEDLANKAILERILADERLRIQFSADHIIEVNRRPSSEEEKVEVIYAADQDRADADYWNMSTPAESRRTTTTIKRRHHEANSYWDWPSTPQQQQDEMIRQILQAEQHRQMFSIDHVEQNLQKEAAALCATSVPSNKAASSSDAYWTWNANIDPTSSSQDLPLTAYEQASLIESILQAERARQLLSIDHMEKNLTTAKKEPVRSSMIASNDDYWAGF